jgi:hypothetical protein
MILIIGMIACVVPFSLVAGASTPKLQVEVQVEAKGAEREARDARGEARVREELGVRNEANSPYSALPKLDASFGRLPLSFEPNVGQTDEAVKFLARGKGYTLFLTPGEAVLALRSAASPLRPASLASIAPDPRDATDATTQRHNDATDATTQQTIVRMRFDGANPAPRTSGLEPLPGIVNYFIGNDPKKWRTNIPTYQKVEYQDVYPGIDLAYYGNQGKLEYDLIVAPGADPTQIKLAFDGAEKIEVDPASGDLVLTLRPSRPASLASIAPESSGATTQRRDDARNARDATDSTTQRHNDAIDAKDAIDAPTLRLQKPLVYQLDAKGHKTLVAGNYVLRSEQRLANSEQPAANSEQRIANSQQPALSTRAQRPLRSRFLRPDARARHRPHARLFHLPRWERERPSFRHRSGYGGQQLYDRVYPWG